MIRVNRGEAPEGFANRANAWRFRFAGHRKQNPAITGAAAWRKLRGDIAADAKTLAERFHYKCAYCEARLGHVSHPQIEHYRPKGLTRFEGIMFDWDNWLLSCGICNEGKWAHFPEENDQPLLLNPAEEDPSPHLCFVGPLLRGLTKRGKKTVELVELDRQALRDEREFWLGVVHTLLLLWVESADDKVHQECREHLIWAMQDDAPFAGMTRAFLGEKCPKLKNPAIPHPLLAEDNHRERIRELIENRASQLKELV